VARHNSNFENFTPNHDLKLTKSLQREIKFIFLLILVLLNLKLQVAKFHWVLRQNHGGSHIRMSFKVIWEKVLICARVFQIFQCFQKFLSDHCLAYLLETNDINLFKYRQTNLHNDLVHPFLFCGFVIFFDDSLEVTWSLRVLSFWAFIFKPPAWEVKIAIDWKNSQFSQPGPFRPLSIFWSFIEIFVNSGLFIVSWVSLIRSFLKSEVINRRES
jgi:hypothetical protein